MPLLLIHPFDAQSMSSGMAAADRFARTPQHLITGGPVEMPPRVRCEVCFQEGFFARLNAIRQECRENN